MAKKKEKLPKVTLKGTLTGDVKNLFYRALHERGVISRNGVFLIEGRKKWGSPENFRSGEFEVSDQPFEGFNAGATHIDLPDGQGIHALIKDEKGEVFPISSVRRPEFITNIVHGMFVKRPDGEVHCYEHDGDQLTGARPFKINGELAPLHRLALEHEGAINGTSPVLTLSEGKGFIGSVELTSFNTIVDLLPDFHRLEDLDADEQEDLSRDYAFVMKEIAEDMIYKTSVTDIVSSQMTLEDVDRLIEVSGYAETGKIYPEYNDFDRRKPFDQALFDITLKAMTALRNQGLLAPCPNNGPRNDPKMKAWNEWLNGKFDDPSDDSFTRKSGLMWLSQSPAFGAMTFCIFDKTRDMKKADVNIPKMRKSLRAAFRAFADDLPTSKAGVMTARDMNCAITGDTMMLVGSALKPKLTTHQRRDKFGRYEPLENLETPKSVRHMEIPLPSGKLIVNDWFRIKGFDKGLQALIGNDDDYDINNAAGMDDRARDYFQKAGLCIVQVGNTCPSAYEEPAEDGSKILRTGHIDEDHEEFWDENDVRIKDMPKEAFSTCTDLWANTFADEQVVVDILLASGEYNDRSEAQAALDNYLEKTWTASRVDVGFDQLHLYAPTGYGITKGQGQFDNVFKADELSQNEWQEDMYVLSTKPLTVDPEILNEEEWVWRSEFEPAQTQDEPEP
jgi:hypothetical protein